MSSVVITTAGNIINETPTKGAVNPHECHYFSHQVLYTEDENFCEHVSWELLGDVPVGINIDVNGLISGEIKHFGEQPLCTDNYPLEEIKRDGSNHKNNGRFKHSTFTFNFTIRRNYKVKGLNPDTSLLDCENSIDEYVDSEVNIILVKNHDLDTYLFVHNYLEAGNVIQYNNVKYFYEDINELMIVHPGPFGGCTN